MIKLVCQVLNVKSEKVMFKNKNINGKNNICGDNIAKLRKAYVPKMSQRILAEKMQLLGLDMDKNAVQRIESGQRFVTDIELSGFAMIFNKTCDELLGVDEITEK